VHQHGSFVGDASAIAQPKLAPQRVQMLISVRVLVDFGSMPLSIIVNWAKAARPSF
jgi:hypothetical protein